MPSKEWWKSGLVWIGILTALASSCEIVIQFLQTQDFSFLGIVILIQGLLIIWKRLGVDTTIKLDH